jgi:hypothetical protein
MVCVRHIIVNTLHKGDNDDDDDNDNTDSNFRLCQQFDETVECVSACPTLAKEQYVKVHDRVCSPPNFYICKEMGVKLDNEHWYEHVPKLEETSFEGTVTILWNQNV